MKLERYKGALTRWCAVSFTFCENISTIAAHSAIKRNAFVETNPKTSEQPLFDFLWRYRFYVVAAAGADI